MVNINGRSRIFDHTMPYLAKLSAKVAELKPVRLALWYKLVRPCLFLGVYWKYTNDSQYVQQRIY